MPCANGSLCVLSVPGSPDRYIAVFTSIEQLEAECSRLSVGYTSVKVIDDPEQFLGSLPRDVRVMVDPHQVAPGRSRWREIFRPERAS